MNDNQKIVRGIVVTVLAAVCCWTPVAVLFLTAVGLSAAVVYLDIIFIPLLTASAGFTFFVAFRKWKTPRNRCS